MSVNKKNIVVVGGGYGGFAVAKALDASLYKTHRVVMIERKTHFYHSIGAVRVLSQDNFEQQLLIPYDKLLKHGVVVHAEATEIRKNEVVVDREVDLGDGASVVVPFEYLVIATGSENQWPFKLTGESNDVSTAEIQQQREVVKKAKKILIVGGGPVGVEFAGELATAYKDKEIILVHNRERLLSPDLPTKLTDRLEQLLKSMNVRVILNERVQFPDDFSFAAQDLTQRTLTTDKGTEITSDLQFSARGGTTNSALVSTLDASLLESGTRFVRVRPTLQLAGNAYAHIFAIGDITNIREAKMGYRAGLHAEVAAKNIAALVNGKKLADYKPNPPTMLVTVGNQNGAVLLPMLGGIVMGGFMVRSIKAKDLMVGRFWKEVTGGPVPDEVKKASA